MWRSDLDLGLGWWCLGGRLGRGGGHCGLPRSSWSSAATIVAMAVVCGSSWVRAKVAQVGMDFLLDIDFATCWLGLKLGL